MGKLNLLGVTLYWGEPANPGKMKFHTGTLLKKPEASPRMEQKHFATHEIIGLYGVQIGKSFIGRIALGQWGMEYSEWAPRQALKESEE